MYFTRDAQAHIYWLQGRERENKRKKKFDERQMKNMDSKGKKLPLALSILSVPISAGILILVSDVLHIRIDGFFVSLVIAINSIAVILALNNRR